MKTVFTAEEMAGNFINKTYSILMKVDAMWGEEIWQILVPHVTVAIFNWIIKGWYFEDYSESLEALCM